MWTKSVCFGVSNSARSRISKHDYHQLAFYLLITSHARAINSIAVKMIDYNGKTPLLLLVWKVKQFEPQCKCLKNVPLFDAWNKLLLELICFLGRFIP